MAEVEKPAKAEFEVPIHPVVKEMIHVRENAHQTAEESRYPGFQEDSQDNPGPYADRDMLVRFHSVICTIAKRRAEAIKSGNAVRVCPDTSDKPASQPGLNRDFVGPGQ